MKALRLCLPFLLATAAWADTAADRAAIEAVVRAVFADQTPGGKPVSTLFSSDADSELDRLVELDRRLLRLSKEPMSEVTAPHVVIQSIRFVTPEVALVDAANTQYGAVTLENRIPVLLVMRKEGTDWRIVLLRVLVDSLRINPAR